VSRPIALAIFDMAGTTVRDGGTVEGSFVDAMHEVGAEAGETELGYVRETMGMSKIVVFRHLLGNDEARAAEANAAFEAAYARRLAAGEAEPIPGAESLFADLRAAGVRVCLTTGFSAATQEALIDALGWRALVDLWLAPSPDRRGRPFPDLVFEAVMRLAVDDVRDVAIAGDTANDLLAGSRSGASIVAGVLTGAHDRTQLASAPHTHIVDSVADLAPLLLP
jgi:phosphoglycolate phosphatase